MMPAATEPRNHARRREGASAARRAFLKHLPVLVLLTRGTAAWATDEPAFRYRGREWSPTGSHAMRKLQWSSKVPFDKTYAELTPAQIAWIREQYDGLKPEEEPPYPLGGLIEVFRRVDDKVNQGTPRLEPGPLMVVASVDADGDVQSLKFYKSPNAFATSAVGQALLRTPFKPAKRNGAPVPMDFLLTVELL